MHSELLKRCKIAREEVDVPEFPRFAIRTAAQRSTQPAPRRRTLTAIVLASLSVVAIAAAADVLQRAHLTFTPAGGMVISSDAKGTSRPIHSDAEIREAASHLDFAATLPAGLPEGAVPTHLDAYADMIVVKYDLPGAARASHHLLWMFLANPKAITGKSPAASAYRIYQMRPGKDMAVETFHAGAEQVIVVSNGLTDSEFTTIKSAMHGY